MTAPTALISYSWDSDDHKAWVKSLAERLQADGIDVILDRWAMAPGAQLPTFMEQAISVSDFVLVICTPDYRERSDARCGGVGYEGNIITSEIFYRGNHEKFIPILREGTWAEGKSTDAAAVWIRGGYYIDLRGDPHSEDNYRELVLALLGKRETAPPIGEPMSTLQSGSSAAGFISRPRLSDAYFARQLKGTLAAADNRFASDLHVGLEITQQLETFGRTEGAIDRIKSLAIGIRKRLRLLRGSGSVTEPKLQELDLGVLIDATHDVLEGLATLQASPTGEIPLATIMKKAAAAEENAGAALDAIDDLEREYLADQRPAENGRRRRNSPYSRLEGDVYRLQSILRSARILISEAENSPTVGFSFSEERREPGRPTCCVISPAAGSKQEGQSSCSWGTGSPKTRSRGLRCVG